MKHALALLSMLLISLFRRWLFRLCCLRRLGSCSGRRLRLRWLRFDHRLLCGSFRWSLGLSLYRNLGRDLLRSGSSLGFCRRRRWLGLSHRSDRGLCNGLRGRLSFRFRLGRRLRLLSLCGFKRNRLGGRYSSLWLRALYRLRRCCRLRGLDRSADRLGVLLLQLILQSDSPSSTISGFQISPWHAYPQIDLLVIRRPISSRISSHRPELLPPHRSSPRRSAPSAWPRRA